MAEIDKMASVPSMLPENFEKFAENAAQLISEASVASAIWMKSLEDKKAQELQQYNTSDMIRSFGAVVDSWLTQPEKAMEAQTSLSQQMIALWSKTLSQMSGEHANNITVPTKKDSRFADPEWETNPYFSFLKQAYLIGTSWAEEMIVEAENLDPQARKKAEFYFRQISSALSPANFVLTNPELLRQTMKENGANLVRGMKNAKEDLIAGNGELRIRQTDTSPFVLGENVATTPGKVIFRNEIMELIHYTPTTEKTYATPLIIVPPWINKFYILDLNQEKSMVRWLVKQGHSLFVISWVNPDERHKNYDFEGYMKHGIMEALNVVEKITGSKKSNITGYCVGGTLLASTLAYLAATGHQDRINKATFLTTQVDFTNAGDLLTFVDEGYIKAVEGLMSEHGYLPGTKMAGAFNMLRPADLIWPNIIRGYLKGETPSAFDLLAWNSDSTRMPQANHSFYMRNCYLENNLAKGLMKLGGVTLDLSKVTVPIYNLAAKEDHIAPALSVFEGAKLFGGPMRYVMAGSGHIAGVVNPATKPKYQYWTGGAATGKFDDWVKDANETAGSWWNDWQEWLTDSGKEKQIKALMPGLSSFKALCDAPGEYVRTKI